VSVIYKSPEEIEKIRVSSLLVGNTLAEVAAVIRPGVKTIDLDKVAETYIKDHGSVPAFKGYNGFPGSLCISVNSEIVHGIPGDNELKDGDIVSIDCGVINEKYFGDSAYTFAVGEISDDVRNLLNVTKQCLQEAVNNAYQGRRIGDIGYSVQEIAEKNGFSVVRELVGHGVGKQLHEKPEVPNYGRRGRGILLKTGMVIAIEPMINSGKRNIKQLKDGWTIETADKKPSAHFEHTVSIGKNKADVLSSFEKIMVAEKKNKNLSTK
jgi:methionyl aminopeptidase